VFRRVNGGERRTKLPRYKRHALIYTQHHGDGPYTCEHCGEIILKLGKRSRDGAIHHKNEDKLDNRIENLSVMHFGCHRSLHTSGDENPSKRPEIAAKISASLMGHEVTQATRDAVSRANKGNKYSVGRVYTPEMRERMRQAMIASYAHRKLEKNV